MTKAQSRKTHRAAEGLLEQTAALAGKAVGIGARTIGRAVSAVGLGGERTMAKKRSASKRDLLKKRTGKMFAKRTAKGRFKEIDSVKRSIPSDRRKKAKRKVRSGYGDQGDR